MKSYVKIYGPPILKSIKGLEKIALDMPEVCIMSPSIKAAIGIDFSTPYGGGKAIFDSPEGVLSYFGVDDLTEERCNTIVSKSGESLGEYDFFFEWFKNPTMEEINDLIERIDNTIEPLGARYTITTK
ncbi:hypothetical protein ACFL0D_00400 [Thermoproteota archaeon]